MDEPNKASLADLSFERKKRNNDASSMTPAELIRWAHEDAEKGEFDGAKESLIVVFKPNAFGRTAPVIYTTGMTSAEQLGYLALLTDHLISELKK